MKTLVIFVLFHLLAAVASHAPNVVRMRQWNKYSFMFASKINDRTDRHSAAKTRRAELSTTAVPATAATSAIAIESSSTAVPAAAATTSRPAQILIHRECLLQVPNTLMFRGFMQVFYTFDIKVLACTAVFGVTVQSEAPNVFDSYEACQQKCCRGFKC